jgi:hypothetical protein
MLMRALKMLFSEIKHEMAKIILLEAFINAALFFLITHIIISFLELSVLISLMLTGAFFAWSINKSSSKYMLKDIEKENPQVKVMLRTAKDNIKTENVLTNILAVELIDKIKTANIGKVLGKKTLIQKIIAICGLSFFMIVIVSFNINIGTLPDLAFFDSPEGRISSIELNESDNIFGDIKVATLGNEELELQINPTLSELDFTKEKDVEELPDHYDQFPVDVEATGAESSSENKPEEFVLAKKYSLAIRNG